MAKKEANHLPHRHHPHGHRRSLLYCPGYTVLESDRWMLNFEPRSPEPLKLLYEATLKVSGVSAASGQKNGQSNQMRN